MNSQNRNQPLPTLQQRIIITPFHLPWNRPADYQRQTCLELAKHNTVICLACNEPLSLWKRLLQLCSGRSNAESMTEQVATRNIIWLKPILWLPGNRFLFIKSINWALSITLFLGWSRLHTSQNHQHAQLQTADFKSPILWIFDPIFAPLQKILAAFTSVYDCVDFHRATTPQHAELTQKLEEQLIQNTDVFVVNSHILATTHQQLRPPDAIVAQGFAANSYTKAPFANPTKPFTIGFMGAVGDRLDYDLLQEIATRFPQVYIELIGPVETQQPVATESSNWRKKLSKLLKQSNVSLLPPQPKKNLWQTTKRWKIGLIPYLVNHEFNTHCFPMKLFEYLYMGIPVVSTQIPEVTSFYPYAVVAKTSLSYGEAIAQLLNTSITKSAQTKMRQLSYDQRYETKIAQISQQIFKIEAKSYRKQFIPRLLLT